MFDVTMGSYVGAKSGELVGLYILSKLAETLGHKNMGLYRDDALALIKGTNGRNADTTRDVACYFSANWSKIVIFLDITLHLNNGQFSPNRKPDNEQLSHNTLVGNPTTCHQANSQIY